MAALGLDSATASVDFNAQAFQKLRVSDNHRFLVHNDGKPFFWLGDTAWEIFHRLNREDADKYLKDRADRGFTVIQAVAIAEFDGHSVPNAYGHLPLENLDPTKPAVVDGPNNDYWDHVDYIVQKANSLGLQIGFLPTWGRYWHDKVYGDQPMFNPMNADIYGEWLGKRYRNASLVWILGGDRKVDTELQKETVRAMARGLRRGDGGNHLISFHPSGGGGSSSAFHTEPWLDFNMRQNGHSLEFTGNYENTRADYNLSPIKPVVDAEPIYEDHPVSFNQKKLGHSVAADVRRAAYWDLFGGAFGHTYGHHSVWQMFTPDRSPVNDPLLVWTDAIRQPGAAQMGIVRRLIESRPFLTRIPDDSIIVDDKIKTAVPGAGTRHFAATRDESGSYAMVYAPVGRSFKVNMAKITGSRVKAWWFNPRNGEAKAIGEFSNSGEREFISPDRGEAIDWLLVLDDASKRFPPP
ncbi:MAG: glycoside hydrolase family 140 protein, partial [Chthonomonadales bacterium]